MSRYIDADALTDELIRESEADTSKSIQTSFAKSVCLLLCKALELQQTVDAVPVIRCKDCEDCTETKLYDGQRWNYCMRLRCVVKENDFCCWAERKYPKIKAKVTE